MKETATGVSQNASGTETQVVRASAAKLEFLPSTPKAFKPGMSYTGQVCSFIKPVEATIKCVVY